MHNLANPDERTTSVILQATMMARFRARFVKCIVKLSPTTLVPSCGESSSNGTDCTTWKLQGYLLIVIRILAGASMQHARGSSFSCRVCNFPSPRDSAQITAGLSMLWHSVQADG
jgi:hypothetical protein